VDFFEAQDSARSRTRTLVVLFVAAVLAIIGAIYAVVHIFLGPGPAGPIDPVLLLVVAAATTALVGAGSTVRTLQLRQGGGRVAELLGGRRVRPDTADEKERRLLNVVEEMAIASGMPVPAVYVMDHEAGHQRVRRRLHLDDAAVGVTRGTLEQLSRDELQGVIAHEFSHILNGDMRINIRLMGILFGILLLAVVGRGLLHSGARAGGRSSRRGGGGGAQVAILGLALVLVGYIGVFFGRLIQAAVSRQREYLADAAAVQFTRNPQGISGALRKIGEASAGSRIADHHAQEAGHFFFANGIGSSFTSLLATHPPLADRIRRVDPAAGAAQSAPAQAGPTERPRRRRHSPAPARPARAAAAAAAPAAVAGAALMASVGAPQPEHVAYATRLLQQLPATLQTAAHDPESAVALLCALLLQEGAAGERQRQLMAEHGGDALSSRRRRSCRTSVQWVNAARLPLLDLLLPALRELPAGRQQAVAATAHALVEADERVDVFEFALLHVLGRQLGADGRDRSASVPAPAASRRCVTRPPSCCPPWPGPPAPMRPRPATRSPRAPPPWPATPASSRCSRRTDCPSAAWMRRWDGCAPPRRRAAAHSWRRAFSPWHRTAASRRPRRNCSGPWPRPSTARSRRWPRRSAARQPLPYTSLPAVTGGRTSSAPTARSSTRSRNVMAKKAMITAAKAAGIHQKLRHWSSVSCEPPSRKLL
jgi:Zn-dependent protease with chaperone function